MVEQATPQRLWAMIYRFEIWSNDERIFVTEERVSASTFTMLVPQLNSCAHRTRVDQGPGIIVFDNYRDARQGAQNLAAIATHVELHEVVPSAADTEGWVVNGGGRYRTVDGSTPEIVKD